jgi:acyl carrier protein
MIKEKLTQFFLEDLSFSAVVPPDLAPDSPLIELGVLDSLGILKLLIFLEDTFGVTLHPEDIVEANFKDILTIESFVEHKLHGGIPELEKRSDEYKL